MANVTTAQGTFSFDENFYHTYQDFLEDYFDNTNLSAEYGITDVNSQGNGTFAFYADGRWSMANILSWCLMPVYSKPNTAFAKYTKLLDYLRESKTSIKFDYTDYDPGMQWRVHEQATLYPNSDTTKNRMVIKDFTSQDLPIDDYSLIQADLEDGLDVIDLNDTSEPIFRDCIVEPIMPILQKHGINLTPDQVENKISNYVNSNDQYKGGIVFYRYEDGDPDALNDWYDYDLHNAFNN